MMVVGMLFFQHNKHNVFAVTVLCCFVVASLSFLREVIVVQSSSASASNSSNKFGTAFRSSDSSQQLKKKGKIDGLLLPQNSSVEGSLATTAGGSAAEVLVRDDDYDLDDALSDDDGDDYADDWGLLEEEGSPTTASDDDDDDAYTHPVPELLADPTILRNLPVPLQVLERYKEQHGVESLRKQQQQQQPQDGDRKYAVVFYACPIQAGNRLHHYLTGMLWSILTNRTMLVKYWDTDTCFKYGSEFSHSICTSANNATGCDSILHRAPWIPTYDEWAPKLGLLDDAKDEPYELPFYSTHPASISNPRYPWGPGNDADSAFGVDVKFDDRTVVVFAQTRFKISFLARKDTRETLLHSAESRRTCKGLYGLGSDFLFGALHRYSFELSQHMKDSVPKQQQRAQQSLLPSEAYTVALHSRHIDVTLDGCDISREQRCMQRLLLQQQQQAKGQKKERRPCVVMLMSDRECTIAQMTEWLEERKQGCTVQVASHESSTDYLSEHGPFAGAGFFQDLAMASTARSAFVGLSRSSSDLILELIEFNRKMQAWRDGVDPTDVPDVDKCLLKKIVPVKRLGKKHEANTTWSQNATTDTESRPQQFLQPENNVSSCLNPNATFAECERVVRRSHKMGYVLTRQLFDGSYPVEVTQHFRREIPKTVDYRDVVLTRNWYESLISGYLYHKSGRECSLSPFGKPIDYSFRKFNNNWETLLSWVEPDPPKEVNQSLCAYLGSTPVEKGMRVYIDVAFGRWYNGLVRNWELSKLDQDRNRTLFVCYEKLTASSPQSQATDEILEWLFPGFDDKVRTVVEEPEKQEEYTGDHSTSHDASLRRELEGVIRHLDLTVFEGRIAFLNDQFGCGV